MYVPFIFMGAYVYCLYCNGVIVVVNFMGVLVLSVVLPIMFAFNPQNPQFLSSVILPMFISWADSVALYSPFFSMFAFAVMYPASLVISAEPFACLPLPFKFPFICILPRFVSSLGVSAPFVATAYTEVMKSGVAESSFIFSSYCGFLVDILFMNRIMCIIK